MITACTTVRPNIDMATYAKEKKEKGTVIFAVNWGRKWNCGKYDNAQIISLGFDHLPAKNLRDDSSSDIFINTPSRIINKPKYINYVFQINEGEYALSQFDIKIAKSINEVTNYMPHKKILVKKSGTFSIKKGETIYIGHFFVDCVYNPPIVWRYYINGKKNFDEYVKILKKEYPFLKKDNIKFKLFKTSLMGNNYSLSKEDRDK
jgi:hypothetical protein